QAVGQAPCHRSTHGGPLWLEGVDENRRVDACVVQADVPVQMRPGGTPGGAHFADHLATTDLLALLHIELGQMAVHGDQALPMIYEYRLAIEEIVGHDGHDAIGGRLDRCAGRHG